MDGDQYMLDDRSVLRISGVDAKSFLDGLVTCDLDKIDAKTARLGALLSPQGKILFDFLIIAVPDRETPGYYLDCARPAAAGFAKRLGFYKLRAKLAIEDLSASHRIIAGWGEAPMPSEGIVYADPRHSALGWRAIIGPDGETTDIEASDATAYLNHRIALGVPDIHEDFGLGDVFPHEMMMDQLQGVDFDKGCYVGQEVVSRMQHRGTARTRILIARFERGVPPRASEIVAGGKSLGRLGSGTKNDALALVRIDRVSDALAESQAITADGQALTLQKPAYARFAFPLTPAQAAE